MDAEIDEFKLYPGQREARFFTGVDMHAERDRFTFLIDVMNVADKYGLSITSFKRAPDYNRIIGGHPLSRHLTWDGVDLVLPALSMKEYEAKEACENALADLRECGYHGYVRKAGNRQFEGKEVPIFQIHIQRQKPRSSK